jgi:hypothetical protein
MCMDPAVSYLNAFGYNVIRLPRTGIDPLQVLTGKPGSLQVLGALSDFVVGGPVAPAITRDGAAPDISTKATQKMELAAGLGVVNQLLTSLGAIGGSIDAEYNAASKVQVLFRNVLQDSVLPMAIIKYLQASTPDAGPILLEWLKQAGSAYCITDTIKSDSFVVRAFDSHDVKLALNVSGIAKVLGGKVSVSPSSEHENALCYEGTTKLNFGFRVVAFGLVPDENGDLRFRLQQVANPVVLKGVAPAEAGPGFVLLGEGELQDIEL